LGLCIGEVAVRPPRARPSGQYWITGGKYPQVPCDPPEHRGAPGGNRCLGKVHHFHLTHRPFPSSALRSVGSYTTGVGADSTIEQDAFLVYLRPDKFTEVRFHVVDAGTYPECTPNTTRSCS